MASPEPPHSDDSLMDRFDRSGLRRFRARDAVIAVLALTGVLVLCAGQAVRNAGEATRSGIGRAVLLDVGRPTAWIAEHLPFRAGTHRLVAWLSPDVQLTGPGAFFVSSTSAVAASGVAPVTRDSFDPGSLGLPAPAPRPLHTLLVTGDSMSQPLDQDLAQLLAARGVRVLRDPHIGTGISSTVLVDWGRLSAYQVRHDRPDAVVVFIGANDGYSMPGPRGASVDCCSADWAALYATRVRQMMDSYRQAGAGHVYWLTLPTPRERARQAIARVVNAAIDVAAEPWRDQVRVIDTVPVFSPGGVYRDAMSVGGQPTIVRQSDGIHLNDAGAALAAKLVLGVVGRDFRP